MPKTDIRVFRDSTGRSDFLDWLGERGRSLQLRAKCYEKLILLGHFGNELRRPLADYLRDGVYELRFKYRNVNYRIFYGFIGRQIALVSHVATKLDKVAEKDIDTAASRLQLAKSDRDTYTAEMDLPDG